jgi:hypothetical protein
VYLPLGSTVSADVHKHYTISVQMSGQVIDEYLKKEEKESKNQALITFSRLTEELHEYYIVTCKAYHYV